jgi:hypothetical protein
MEARHDGSNNFNNGLCIEIWMVQIASQQGQQRGVEAISLWHLQDANGAENTGKICGCA